MKPSPSQDYLLEVLRNYVAHNKEFKIQGLAQDDLQQISGLSRERLRQIKNILLKKKLIRLKQGRPTCVWIPQ